MSDNNAKIRISLKDGEFELSGSELFVSQQIESFRELIVESLKNQKLELKKPGDKLLSPPNTDLSNNSTTGNPPGGQTGLPTATYFPRVFHIENGTVSIIKKAPGNNSSQKSVATALIYIWAKNSVGQMDVLFPEIRALCESQGCLDKTNFAKHMKSAKEYIVVEGKGKFQKCKLTLPGKEKALSIVEELNK